MKAADIRELSIEDIKEKLMEEKANYHQLKMNHKMAHVENPIQLRTMRKSIARLNTELTKKLKESAQN